MTPSLTRLALACTLALALAGCSGPESARGPETPPAPSAPATQAPPSEAPAERAAWLDFELEDAVTGERFRLADYEGEQVLLHSFAVW